MLPYEEPEALRAPWLPSWPASWPTVALPGILELRCGW